MLTMLRKSCTVCKFEGKKKDGALCHHSYPLNRSHLEVPKSRTFAKIKFTRLIYFGDVCFVESCINSFTVRSAFTNLFLEQNKLFL